MWLVYLGEERKECLGNSSLIVGVPKLCSSAFLIKSGGVSALDILHFPDSKFKKNLFFIF